MKGGMKAMLFLAAMSGAAAEGAPALRPVVEVEEEVYAYQPADNGAGPMWCHGNTCIVRLGRDVLASGIETLPGYVPLNNVRWMLLKRADGGWKRVRDGRDTHEREPCPLVCFADGRVFLSTNPNSSKPDEYDGPAQPRVLQFDALDPAAAIKTLIPKWNRKIAFHSHTYRSFAADPARREFVLFYNTAYDKTYWTFRDSQGRWAAQGELDFPWGAEYDKPQPVRICYPTVQLTNRAVHFCGVSDIVEPYEPWRKYKKEITGRKWDYDFRRLFYTWSDDITSGKFHPWVEIASRDKTAGRISACDLWCGPDGRVHALWFERAIDERLRKKFFPDAKQSLALNYAILRDGKVLLRKALHKWDEGDPGEAPGRGRFHVAPGGRLFVIYYVSGRNDAGRPVAENRILEIARDGSPGDPVKAPLARPLSFFFTAGPRGGSAPSEIIDLYGRSDRTMRYVRINLRLSP